MTILWQGASSLVRYHARVRHRRLALAVVLPALAACNSSQPPPPAQAKLSADAAFTAVAGEYFEDLYRRQPTQATYLGIHKFDDQLDDYSRQGVTDAVAAAKGFRARVAAIEATALSTSSQLDREQLLHAIDSRILTIETIRPWARDPDTYSSGITNTAYLMIKRAYAPDDERMKLLIAREKQMPAALLEARKNLDNPPEILTQIAIDQLDGSQGFFKAAVAQAFPDVKDAALVAQFKQSNDAVIAALGDYKQWLQTDLLKRSTGDFAIGADTYAKKLAADEMIDTPVDRLLAIAEQDMAKNKSAFADTAKEIDPSHTPMEVLATIQADHPSADKLLSVTQAELDALGRFMADHHIVTVPQAAPARVQETPPFLRATTTASMDTPGPYETKATEAYYNMTLPDPRWPATQTADFMTQWYYAAISNVSVHEVWPGHYLQFLYAKQFPSDVRKVVGVASNVEGWAHYCEQMVLDEGFHDGDPKYRLAQIQDALLRDARFIAGIRMHTKGMTVKQAEDLFVNDGYQPRPVAVSEAKRGTTDATYGYYTMGKLMILKLREDYKQKKGSQFTLRDFHDTFIHLGPLALPLMRRAMLGETGTLF